MTERLWCRQHREAAHAAGRDIVAVMFENVVASLRDREFYATAYRFENGEGLPPGAFEARDIPVTRRPSTGAIMEAFARHGPACCFAEDAEA